METNDLIAKYSSVNKCYLLAALNATIVSNKATSIAFYTKNFDVANPFFVNEKTVTSIYSIR